MLQRNFVDVSDSVVLRTKTPLFPSSRWIPLRTGSYYNGDWNERTMSGHGKYHMADGAMYVGGFENGLFHGSGTIYYPIGSQIKGVWENGKCLSRKYIFSDGLEFDLNNWKYCQMPDRRYTPEHLRGLRPAAHCRITNRDRPVRLPDGLYDTGYGFYQPLTNTVHDYETNELIRVPTKAGAKWIMDNCRKGGETVVGFRPEFYENWYETDVQTNVEMNDSTAKKAIYDPVADQTTRDMNGRITITTNLKKPVGLSLASHDLRGPEPSAVNCGGSSTRSRQLLVMKNSDQSLKYCQKIMNLIQNAANEPSNMQFGKIKHGGKDLRLSRPQTAKEIAKKAALEDDPGFW
ncbi:uncharacterized protein LOC126833837 [Adelges cooleyi]|uniref:uncharacterized protein LOC126833837 n=1 Tax=Adelges cooleyi TaxID=133065 RepID=UPI00217F9E64|nr:uncharacterized protein LOC126833837 [Adelges cooleyi]